jgi:hypothetical protein
MEDQKEEYIRKWNNMLTNSMNNIPIDNLHHQSSA